MNQRELKQSVEWGIHLSRLKRLLPKSLLWQLSFVHLIVIVATMGTIGWLVYTKACSLAGGVGRLGNKAQMQFNTELRDYLLVFTLVGIVIGIILHFYLLQRTLQPIREMIQSTKQLRQGAFPEPIHYVQKDEVGELITHYNALIKQLEVNEKTREKTISDVSHEFRTPLTNLNGFLQALAKGDIEGNKEIFQALGEEAKKLQNMVEQLEELKEWDYLKRDIYVRKEFMNMKDIVQQCIAMYKHTLEKEHLQLEIDVDEADVFIHTTGIQQVIGNLLDNAIRYHDGEGPVQINGRLEKEVYRLEIANPGKAFTQEEENQLFTRFYQIEREKQESNTGSGLGLAICKEIITQHQGEIYTYRKGSQNVFGLTIPNGEHVNSDE